MPLIKHKPVKFYMLGDKWELVFSSKYDRDSRGECDIENKKIYIYNEGNMSHGQFVWMQVLLHELFELASHKRSVVFCQDVKGKSWDDEGYVKYIMTHDEMDGVMYSVERCLSQILPQIDNEMLQRWMDDGLEYAQAK